MTIFSTINGNLLRMLKRKASFLLSKETNWTKGLGFARTEESNELPASVLSISEGVSSVSTMSIDMVSL